METIFEGSSCKAMYIAEKKRIFFTSSGYAKIDEHKAMFTTVFKFMNENTVHATLHDLRNLKGTFTQLNDWLIETFKPASQLGLKFAAMVKNDDIFTAFAIDDVMKKSIHIKFQVFKTLDEAEEWLSSREA